MCKAKVNCSSQLQSTQWLTAPRHAIKEMYNLLREQGCKVHCQQYVWNRFSVPKHRFILWLTLMDRLKTRARLHQLGIGSDHLCAICGTCPETVPHLFFECAFSTECRKLIMSWLGYDSSGNSVLPLLNWVQK